MKKIVSKKIRRSIKHKSEKDIVLSRKEWAKKNGENFRVSIISHVLMGTGANLTDNIGNRLMSHVHDQINFHPFTREIINEDEKKYCINHSIKFKESIDSFPLEKDGAEEVKDRIIELFEFAKDLKENAETEFKKYFPHWTYNIDFLELELAYRKASQTQKIAEFFDRFISLYKGQQDRIDTMKENQERVITSVVKFLDEKPKSEIMMKAVMPMSEFSEMFGDQEKIEFDYKWEAGQGLSRITGFVVEVKNIGEEPFIYLCGLNLKSNNADVTIADKTYKLKINNKNFIDGIDETNLNKSLTIKLVDDKNILFKNLAKFSSNRIQETSIKKFARSISIGSEALDSEPYSVSLERQPSISDINFN